MRAWRSAWTRHCGPRKRDESAPRKRATRRMTQSRHPAAQSNGLRLKCRESQALGPKSRRVRRCRVRGLGWSASQNDSLMRAWSAGIHDREAPCLEDRDRNSEITGTRGKRNFPRSASSDVAPSRRPRLTTTCPFVRSPKTSHIPGSIHWDAVRAKGHVKSATGGRLHHGVGDVVVAGVDADADVGGAGVQQGPSVCLGGLPVVHEAGGDDLAVLR